MKITNFLSVAFKKRARTAAYAASKSGADALVLSMALFILFGKALVLEAWLKFFKKYDDMLLISPAKITAIEIEFEDVLENEAFKGYQAEEGVAALLLQGKAFLQPVQKLLEEDPKTLCVAEAACPDLLAVMEAHCQYQVLKKHFQDLPDGEELWKAAVDHFETLRVAQKLPGRFQYNKFKQRDSQ